MAKVDIVRGFQRLALLLGAVGGIWGGVIGYLIGASSTKDQVPGVDLLPMVVLLVGAVVGFLVFWGAVSAIAWVVNGFMKD